MAVYSKNCPEFVVAEQACFAAGGATVPLYDTLGPETVSFVLAQTGASVVVCFGDKEVEACLSVDNNALSSSSSWRLILA